jgi:hypothetical protein
MYVTPLQPTMHAVRLKRASQAVELAAITPVDAEAAKHQGVKCGRLSLMQQLLPDLGVAVHAHCTAAAKMQEGAKHGVGKYIWNSGASYQGELRQYCELLKQTLIRQ